MQKNYKKNTGSLPHNNVVSVSPTKGKEKQAFNQAVAYILALVGLVVVADLALTDDAIQSMKRVRPGYTA
ncbi:MAG: hypothetical protein GXP23_08950 [Gammaproteobacteria bacterium]|nr:hypothetical protein [Gammaproteobacteria bacterium]